MPFPLLVRPFAADMEDVKTQGGWWRRATGPLAFLIVLLLMPLGHALMVLMEQVFGHAVFASAFAVGAIGIGLLWWGVARPGRDLYATLLGAIAGVLVWTGWVEFSFVWLAGKLGVQPLVENGEVVTKPEYLVMLSSIGLLGTMLMLYIFSHTRCPFFNWFQKRMGLFKKLAIPTASQRPLAMIAFMEMVMLIWTFYVVLLVVYDDQIAGDRHPATWIVAFGSLAWSLYLFTKLLRIRSFDHAVRYAVPTVVIFWNFVEIIGRWGLLKEIWIHPLEHWLENSLILSFFLGATVYYIIKGRKDRNRRIRPVAVPAPKPQEKAAAPKGKHAVPSY